MNVVVVGHVWDHVVRRRGLALWPEGIYRSVRGWWAIAIRRHCGGRRRRSRRCLAGRIWPVRGAIWCCVSVGVGRSGEELQGRVGVVVFDDGYSVGYSVGARFRGRDDDVLVSWFSGGMAVVVGGLRVQGGHGGHGVVLRGKRAGGRVGNTIAIALGGRCGRHAWGGWGVVVGGKLGRGSLSWY